MWLIIASATIILFAVGVWEKRQHRKNVEAIPIRVNVNGIRGKSTVTRLITGVVNEAGFKTIGKTTGTDARMIYWDTDEEKPIKRKPQGPNIGEQMDVIKEAATRNADALVSECMAVHPDYQVTFQEELLQANIGVIVNVLEDHMDVLGPTLDEVAEAFTATIPYDGHLIITNDQYAPYYKKIATRRHTKVIVADSSRIKESFLRQFEYMVFPDNAALALAVAEALNIDEETAYKGMLNARPDPGAMRIVPLATEGDANSYFVNGFAANDATSTLSIWNRVKQIGYPTDQPIIIMNCRADRVDRTAQFAKDVLPYIESEHLMLIGETTAPIVKAYDQGQIPCKTLHNLEGMPAEDVLAILLPLLEERIVYGIGNIHGVAEPLIEQLQAYKIKQSLVS